MSSLSFNHPTLIIMVGCSGSGKTTWVHKHLDHLKPTIICADDFCVDLDGVYTFSHDGVQAAHCCVRRAFNEATDRQDPLIVMDNTNLHSHHRQRYIDWCRKLGYQVFIVALDVTPEIGALRTPHHVPAHGIEGQRKRCDIGVPGVYYIPVKRPASNPLLDRHDAIAL